MSKDAKGKYYRRVRGQAYRSYNYAPTLTAEEAKTELSPALTPDTVTLCLLCRGTEETLCYACRALKGERTYIVYLNAQTGTEEEIQELQTSEDGEALR